MNKSDRVMEPSADYQAYLTMDLSKVKPNEYFVIVKGKLFGKGMDLSRILKKARKQYPGVMPTIGKMPPRGVLAI